MKAYLDATRPPMDDGTWLPVKDVVARQGGLCARCNKPFTEKEPRA